MTKQINNEQKKRELSERINSFAVFERETWPCFPH